MSTEMNRGVGRLLERDTEFGEINELLRDARTGEGALVLVEGAAGTGKTALLDAVKSAAADDGFLVLEAGGAELERDFPFGVVRSLFEPALGRLSEADRAEALSGAASLAQPALDAAPSRLGDAPALVGVLHGVYWLCANIAERSPLLLLIDDAHWADVASLRWLAYLARRLDGLPVAVVTATRLGTPEPAASLFEDLRREESTRIIDLAPLSTDGVRGLLQAAFGAAADDDFVIACHEQTAGNPLLLSELAHALIDAGVRPEKSAARRVLSLPPRHVLRSVLVRLGRLPAAAAAVAQAVAVLEHGSVRDATRLAGLDQIAATEAVDSLVAAGILTTEPSLRFVHPLLRTAVYEDIPPARRASDHVRAAELLRPDPGAAGRVAAHLLACEPTGEAWAFDHLRASARAALARGAPETAVMLLERCLAERPERAVRAVVLHELGQAERVLGSAAAIDHLTEARETTPDPLERIAIARHLAPSLVAAMRLREAYELLERTLEEVPAEDRELALTIEAELLWTGMVGPDLQASVAARVARLPPLAGTTRAERLVLANLARYVDITSNSQKEAAEVAERAIAGGQLLFDQTADTPTFVMALVPLVGDGRLDTVCALCEHAITDARRRGSPLGVALSSSVLGFAEANRGNLRAAEAAGQTALELSQQTGLFPGVTSAVRVLVEVALERGELERAEALLTENFLAGALPDAFNFFNLILFPRARLRLAQGRTEEAIADLVELGDRATRSGQHEHSHWRSTLATVLAARGENERARELIAEDLQVARRRDSPAYLARVLRAAAQVDGAPANLDHLRAALQLVEPTQFRLDHAHVLAELGSGLRRARQRTEARDFLRQALELAHRFGATALAAHARNELLATGARPRKIALSGLDSLTVSERRVAELAAQGMTNKQIAQTLFVTHKTVSTHLAHTYSKLEISGRGELADKLIDDEQLAGATR